MDFFSILTLAGGLAFFLYGMNTMSSSMEKLAGGKFEMILQKFMSNKFKALLLGVVVTAVIQSSSATTVMVIGLVNSRIMSLYQAISVILGAKVGTTVTAWLLSLTGISSDNFFLQLLKPTSFSPVLALIGIIFIIRKRSQKKIEIGRILVGFAVLMFGITTMSQAMTPLSESPAFAHVMEVLHNPVLAFVVGALLTVVVQSSSASVGILQAMALASPIGYAVVVPMVVGQNVGASISPLLASIGQGKNGKRAAFSYLFANLIGALVFLALFYIIHTIVSFPFMAENAGIAGIAVIHTLFNIFVVIVLTPFVKQLEKLMIKMFPDSPEEEEEELAFPMLDEIFFSTPSFALQRAKDTINEMFEITKESINIAAGLLRDYDQELFDKVEKMECDVDVYEDRIGKYLVSLGKQTMATKDSRALSLELQAIGDIERMSDHALNLAEAAREMHEKGLHLSEDAAEDIKIYSAAVFEILDNAVAAFKNEDVQMAYLVEPLEEVIDELKVMIKNRHIERLKEGSCTIELGFILSEITTNMERVSDHCSNLAIYIIQLCGTGSNDQLEQHEFMDIIERDQTEEFVTDYRMFRDKYKLPDRQHVS